MTNLRNYIGLQPTQRMPLELSGHEYKAFGQGSGTFGLPGDFTPPSRFLRSFYTKTTVQDIDDETKMVLAASHILNGVDIPKGAVITPRHTMDYTQYVSFMCSQSRKYYFRLYNSTSITEVDFTDYDLDHNEIYTFDIEIPATFNKL